ncbi:MAG: hypothetical protein UHN59_02345, partial [Bacteroidales bacterium]|nr:hypothetical protein [Bacteroidales bacterium]
FLFWLNFLGASIAGCIGAFLVLVNCGCSFFEKEDFSTNYALQNLLAVVIPTIIILVSGISVIVRFFKRKKKAIRDIVKICLEECER